MSFQNAEHLISNRELGDSLEAIGIIILYLPSGGFFHFGISSLIDTSADRKRVFSILWSPPSPFRFLPKFFDLNFLFFLVILPCSVSKWGGFWCTLWGGWSLKRPIGYDMNGVEMFTIKDLTHKLILGWKKKYIHRYLPHFSSFK